MEPGSPSGGLTRWQKATANLKIRGMESVIATVSGYHGTERFRLIKLISLSGASYVGALAKSTTHLVCWELSGNKYNLAKSFGIKIVSHQWFQDCFEHGRRLPEEPYLMKCGKQIGSLSWKPPPDMDNHTDQKQESHRKQSALADISNLVDGFGGIENLTVNSHDLLSSSLLKEQKTCHDLSGSTSSKSRRRKTSGVDAKINDVSIRKAQRSAKGKNPIQDISTKKAQRHAKGKNPIRDYSLLYVISDSEESFDLNGFGSERSAPSLTSQQSDGQILNVNAVDNQCSRRPEGNNIFESNTVSDGPCTLLETGGSSLGSPLKDPPKDSLTEKPSDTEDRDLSCVICYDENSGYSTSRGILPCGHRFCYSCIHDWANIVTLQKKVPSCPLCKSSFTSIIKVDEAASTEQKIYSQTIPSSSSVVDIYAVTDRGILQPHSSIVDMFCIECRNDEPEDLLTSCHICNNQWVHTCCLDPPLVPWTCIHCRDLRALYQLYR